MGQIKNKIMCRHFFQ